MNLLLAALLLMQERTAEETFRKIEEIILEAKTVVVVFSTDAIHISGQNKIGFACSGSLLLKEDRRVRAEMTRSGSSGGNDSRQIQSDGEEFYALLGQDATMRPAHDTGSTRVQFSRRMKIGFARLGAFQILGGPACSTVLYSPNEFPEVDLRDRFRVSEFKEEAAEKDAKGITYTVILPRRTETCEMTLWYDPATFVPIRRTQIMRWRGGDFTLTEKYSGFTLNADIPDEKFKLTPDYSNGKGKWTSVELTQKRIASVCEAIDLFKLVHGHYPIRLEDLVTAPSDIDPQRFRFGGYLKRVPKDGWDRDLIYRLPGSKKQPYDLLSLGKDGEEGGEGDAADIWNHDAYKKK
jgi:general secretion pathway protein G